MMGEANPKRAFFYDISLETFVPIDHPLRSIRPLIDDRTIRQACRDLYSAIGRPSIPPEQLFLALVGGYLLGVTSDRKLVMELQQKLRAHASFLHFTDKPAPHMFTVRLRDFAPPGTSALVRETGFFFDLSGPNVEPGKLEKVLFRSKTESGGIRPVSRMDGEIGAKLVDEHFRGPIRSLLSAVPIATTGHVWREPPAPGWVLPHAKGDLCIGRYTKLLVENEVTSA